MKKDFFLKDNVQVPAVYKTPIQCNDTQKLRAKDWEKIYSAENKRKLVFSGYNNLEGKEKSINRERSLINDKRDSLLGHIAITNLYVPNNIASK